MPSHSLGAALQGTIDTTVWGLSVAATYKALEILSFSSIHTRKSVLKIGKKAC